MAASHIWLKAGQCLRAQTGTTETILSAGTAWFEVDRSDVLRTKHKALKKAGAAFSQSENTSGTPSLFLLQLRSPSLYLEPSTVRMLDAHC